VARAIPHRPQEKRTEILDGQLNQSEWEDTMVHLLRHQVVLLAMKHGRAPVSVSPALSKGLLRLGVLNDLYELGSVARRLSFLGDGRMLLAELRKRSSVRPAAGQKSSRVMEIAGEDSPQLKDERKWLRD